MQLGSVQQALSDEKLAGWLFYDFRKSNPVAYQVLDLPIDDMYTRRWFYFIPAEGAPTALISSVESHVLHSLPGERRIFRTWQEMQSHLGRLLQPGTRVAMEYSPLNAIPYMSRVDAGTVELVRSFGVEVVSSANIAQRFVAQLSDEQLETHREAARRLIAAKDRLFAELGARLRGGVAQGRAGETLDEYNVQQRFRDLLEQTGVVLSEPPIVAVNANSGNPHYEPSAGRHSPIQRGDLILFDFWARMPGPDSIYADYTWMAFAGTRPEIPARQKEVFAIVSRARDAAIAFVRQRLNEGEKVEGAQVDDVARRVVAEAGYADYFVHRTGHSIATTEHGNGANIDNFETRDQRLLLPNTCCSIEPGIYLPEFGIRSEVDLLVHERDVEVTGIPAQAEITPLL
jgi:Xaa-Pro dipeptidase